MPPCTLHEADTEEGVVMIIEWPTDAIAVPQPRRFDPDELDDLATSVSTIRGVGLLSPLVVRLEGERAILVTGEARLAACRILGRTSVPVAIWACDSRKAARVAAADNMRVSALAMPKLRGVHDREPARLATVLQFRSATPP
jgi:ParB-like chromosome segregation protein Spo0J